MPDKASESDSVWVRVVRSYEYTTNRTLTIDL